MSIRKFFGLIVALAVLLAPSVAAAAERGMTMADHQTQMMEMGHCQSPPSRHGNGDKSTGHSCCISTFIGLPAATVAPLMERFRAQAPAVFELAVLHVPKFVETATPPPRHP